MSKKKKKKEIEYVPIPRSLTKPVASDLKVPITTIEKMFLVMTEPQRNEVIRYSKTFPELDLMAMTVKDVWWKRQIAIEQLRYKVSKTHDVKFLEQVTQTLGMLNQYASDVYDIRNRYRLSCAIQRYYRSKYVYMFNNSREEQLEFFYKTRDVCWSNTHEYHKEYRDERRAKMERRREFLRKKAARKNKNNHEK